MMRILAFAALAASLLFCGCDRESMIENENDHDKHAESQKNDQLNELDWLIGSWINKSEGTTVTTTFEWDKDKHFIIQHFSMKKADEPELMGQQIIAWDPSEKRVRSWVFDSDGGFGQSLWSRQGENWYAETVYTLPDGRKASATHVYTNVDNNSYTFSSVGRDVDGQMLPDIGPFKAVRER